MSKAPHREPPRPLEGNGVRVVVIGTVLWIIALAVTLLFHDRLSDHGRGWWIWVCVAGSVLGLMGIPYMRRYQRRVNDMRD